MCNCFIWTYYLSGLFLVTPVYDFTLQTTSNTKHVHMVIGILSYISVLFYFIMATDFKFTLALTHATEHQFVFIASKCVMIYMLITMCYIRFKKHRKFTVIWKICSVPPELTVSNFGGVFLVFILEFVTIVFEYFVWIEYVGFYLFVHFLPNLLAQYFALLLNVTMSVLLNLLNRGFCKAREELVSFSENVQVYRLAECKRSYKAFLYGTKVFNDLFGVHLLIMMTLAVLQLLNGVMYAINLVSNIRIIICSVFNSVMFLVSTET